MVIFVLGGLMKIIVADRRGIVFSAIESGLRKRNIQTPTVLARDGKTLREFLGLCADVVVVSAQLLPGYTTNEQLAEEVKKQCSGAVFVVYNSVVEKHGPNVDLRIPSFVGGGDQTIGLHIVDYLSDHVFVVGTGVYVQLSLVFSFD
jgi:hypothetical protein